RLAVGALLARFCDRPVTLTTLVAAATVTAAIITTVGLAIGVAPVAADRWDHRAGFAPGDRVAHALCVDALKDRHQPRRDSDGAEDRDQNPCGHGRSLAHLARKPRPTASERPQTVSDAFKTTATQLMEAS